MDQRDPQSEQLGYHEDQNTAQRLFLDLPRNGPTTGRKIILKYLARKGQGGVGQPRYDSLGQWNYTQHAPPIAARA
jgi:hypothetical protein